MRTSMSSADSFSIFNEHVEVPVVVEDDRLNKFILE